MAAKPTGSEATSAADEEVEIDPPPTANNDQPPGQDPPPQADPTLPNPRTLPALLGSEARQDLDSNAPQVNTPGAPILDSLLQPGQHQDVEVMEDVASTRDPLVDETEQEHFADARDATLPPFRQNPLDPERVLFNPNLDPADAIALLRRQVEQVHNASVAQIREAQGAELETRQRLRMLATQRPMNIGHPPRSMGDYQAGIAQGAFGGRGRGRRIENILASDTQAGRPPSAVDSLLDSTASSLVVSGTPAITGKRKRPTLQNQIGGSWHDEGSVSGIFSVGSEGSRGISAQSTPFVPPRQSRFQPTPRGPPGRRNEAGGAIPKNPKSRTKVTWDHPRRQEEERESEPPRERLADFTPEEFDRRFGGYSRTELEFAYAGIDPNEPGGRQRVLDRLLLIEKSKRLKQNPSEPEPNQQDKILAERLQALEKEERAKKEREGKERRRRAREQAEQEREAQEKAYQAQVSHDQKVEAHLARLQQIREQADRDLAAAQSALREENERDEKVRKAQSDERLARDQEAQVKVLREQLERERKEREIAERELRARQQTARDAEAREKREREEATREQAARDQVARDLAEADLRRRDEAQRKSRTEEFMSKVFYGQQNAAAPGSPQPQPKPESGLPPKQEEPQARDARLTVQEASELLEKLRQSQDELQQTRITLNEHIRRDLERARQRTIVPSIPSTDGFTTFDPTLSQGSAGATPLPSIQGQSLGTGSNLSANVVTVASSNQADPQGQDVTPDPNTGINNPTADSQSRPRDKDKAPSRSSRSKKHKKRSSSEDSSSDSDSGGHRGKAKADRDRRTASTSSIDNRRRSGFPAELPRSVIRSIEFPTWGGRQNEMPFYRWKKSFEEYCSLNNVQYSQWGTLLRIALRDFAKTWIELEDVAGDWTYDQAVDRLAKEFDQQSTPLQAAAGFGDHIQGPNESVHAYFRKLNESISLMFLHNPKMDRSMKDALIMGAAMKGIREDLKEKAPMATRTNDLETMKDMYYAVELNQKDVNRPSRRQTPSREPSPKPPNTGRNKAGVKVTWDPSVRKLKIEGEGNREVTLEEIQEAFRAEGRDVAGSLQHQLTEIKDQLQKMDLGRSPVTAQLSSGGSNGNRYVPTDGYQTYAGCYYCGKIGHTWVNCYVRLREHGEDPPESANPRWYPPYQLPYAPDYMQKTIQDRIDNPALAVRASSVLLNDWHPAAGAQDSLMQALTDINAPKTTITTRRLRVSRQKQTSETQPTHPSALPFFLTLLMIPLLQVVKMAGKAWRLFMAQMMCSALVAIIMTLALSMYSHLLTSGGVSGGFLHRRIDPENPGVFTQRFENFSWWTNETNDRIRTIMIEDFKNRLAEANYDKTQTLNYSNSEPWRSHAGALSAAQGHGTHTVSPEFEEFNQDSKFFANILVKAKSSLAATANLALGTVAVPEGLVVVSSDYVWKPMITQLAAPQWMPVNLRHPRYYEACNYLQDVAALRNCLLMIETDFAQRRCPSTLALQNEFNSIMKVFRTRYQGAVNPAFYAKLQSKFCSNNPDLCATVPYGTNKTIDRRRPKRGVTGIFSGLLAIGGLVGLSRSIANARDIERLDKAVGYLRLKMDETDRSLRVITQGMQYLHDKDYQIVDYTIKGFREVYGTIEQLRCAQDDRTSNLAWWTGMHIFRQYLESTLDAILEASTTGKLTPAILPVNELRDLMEKTPALRNSVSHRELSFVYQHATIYPVKLSFSGLQFGYILQIPNPKEGDVYPQYRIYNVGFHRPPVGHTRADSTVYMAPLPQYAVLTRHDGLATLDVTNCHAAPAVMSCPVGAVTRSAEFQPCLQLFLQPICRKCPAAMKCMEEINVARMEGREARVVTTPAGSLIRTAKEEVRSMPNHPIQHPEFPDGEYVRPNLGRIG
jgi:hypothetical protein